jgi:hypothetical protein
MSKTHDHPPLPPDPGMPRALDADSAVVAEMLREHAQRQAERASIELEGEAALRRLFKIAEGDSGQCRHIARFLLGLYNGHRFPFDLTRLRGIDAELFDDCIAVLKMDSQPRQEVHCYFEGGGRKFEQLAKDWDVLDVAALRSAARDAGVRQRGLGE